MEKLRTLRERVKNRFDQVNWGLFFEGMIAGAFPRTYRTMYGKSREQRMDELAHRRPILDQQEPTADDSNTDS